MCSKAYAVFTKAKSNSRIFKFLHKEISHCYILVPMSGKWLVVDQSLNKLTIFAITEYSDIIKPNDIIVKIDNNYSCGLFAFNTCVSLVKRYAGIRNPFILTPYKLLKRLDHGWSIKTIVAK